MTIDVVLIDIREAEVHRRPGLLLRLLGVRHTYSPILRIDAGNDIHDRWVHKYTGRTVSRSILRRLEHLAPVDPVRQHLLLQAADEADAIH